MRRRLPPRRARRTSVLVFGEDATDTAFLAELLVALCPDLQGLVKQIRKPPLLVRGVAADSKVRDRTRTIAALIAAEMTDSDVICVFAHADSDAVEPAHESMAARIESEFAAVGQHVHAVVPAWETEAWLFLWPEAVSDYMPSWSSLDKYRGRSVGLIKDAKEELTRALRPTGPNKGRIRDFRESDAVEIAKRVAAKGVVRKPQASSESFKRFVESVDQCCSSIPV